MSDPRQPAEPITREQLSQELSQEGIEILSRSPAKDAQVAAELQQEANGPDKPQENLPEPQVAPEERQDYEPGLNL